MNTELNINSNKPGGTAVLAGHQVARIGYGAMQLPGPSVWGPTRDRNAALSVLRRAIELGTNHIDTAQFYGDGISNELIEIDVTNIDSIKRAWQELENKIEALDVLINNAGISG